MQNILVNISTQNINYEIIFSDNIAKSLENNIKNIQKTKIFFVIDDYFYSLYENIILELEKKLKMSYILIKHWEKNKNYKTVFKIIDKLLECKISRNDYIVSLWWWVTWDITAFACSLFKRWVNLVQIPTTLLSMLDSSVWWKTWVDYNWIKNLIWTFYNPKLVIINKNFLKTLSKNEILSWMFEWIKHSILNSRSDFLEFSCIYDKILLSENEENLDWLIKKNIEYKLKIVSSDPYEQNWNRRVLNYWHTFWHAIETNSNFKLPHWICVWFWILFANILSYKNWFLDKNIMDEISEIILNLLKNINLKKLDFEKLYDLMLNDKKNSNDKVKFILLKKYWETVQFDATKDEIKEAFKLFIEVINNPYLEFFPFSQRERGHN